MALIDKLTDILAEQAEDNIERAYRILGARPGPGIDIEVFPTMPMNGTWYLSGCTVAGRAFVKKFWPDPFVGSNNVLGLFKRQAEEWGLKYRVVVKFESLGESDERPATS